MAIQFTVGRRRKSEGTHMTSARYSATAGMNAWPVSPQRWRSRFLPSPAQRRPAF